MKCINIKIKDENTEITLLKAKKNIQAPLIIKFKGPKNRNLEYYFKM